MSLLASTQHRASRIRGVALALAVLQALAATWIVLCGNGPLEVPPAFLLKWGTVGTAPGQFRLPHGLAIGDDGLLYVADTYNSRIQVFTRDGVFVRTWGECCVTLDHPRAVAVAKAGYVYVADSFNNRIKVFTRTGGLVASWGIGADEVPDDFYEPAGIAVDDSGYVYVADTRYHRIQKLTATGVVVKMWSGTGSAELTYVLGLATSGGYLYAVEGGLARIIKYSTNGELLAVFGDYPLLDSPNYVATDAAGNVYVTDGDHHRVVKFNPDGKELTRWGPGPDACQFLNPSGITVDADGNIFVADPSDHVFGPISSPACIQKFGTTSSPALPRTWGSLKVRYR